MHALMVPWVVLVLFFSVAACSPSVPQNQAELESIFEAAAKEFKRIDGYDPRFENPFIDIFVRREMKICDWRRDWGAGVWLEATKEFAASGSTRIHDTITTPWRGELAGVGITNEGDLVIRVEIGKRTPILLVERMTVERARDRQWINHDESILEGVRSLRVGQTVFFSGDVRGDPQTYPWRIRTTGDCNIDRAPHGWQRDLEGPVVHFRFHSIATDSESARRW